MKENRNYILIFILIVSYQLVGQEQTAFIQTTFEYIDEELESFGVLNISLQLSKLLVPEK